MKTTRFVGICLITFIVVLVSSPHILEANGFMPTFIDVYSEVEFRDVIDAAVPAKVCYIGVAKDIVLEKPIEIPDGKTFVVKSSGGRYLVGGDGVDVIIVKSGGRLSLWGGLVVTHAKGDGGRGVYVECNGTFNLGCEISGNSAVKGGGVYNEGNFTMMMVYDDISFTVICGNTATEGGGVYNVGTFCMSGGQICGNNCVYAEASVGVGGGVYNIGTVMCGVNCSIFDNAAAKGGDVYTIGVFDGYVGDAVIFSDVVANNDGNDVFIGDRGGRFYVLVVLAVMIVGFGVVGCLFFYCLKRQKQSVAKTLIVSNMNSY